VIPELSAFGPSSEGSILDDAEVVGGEFQDSDIRLVFERANPAVHGDAFADHVLRKGGATGGERGMINSMLQFGQGTL
jgi:hypothetical protein